MRILIATDIKIVKQNNKYYAREKYSKILLRYYDSFGKLVVFSRCSEVQEISKGYEDISYAIDSFIEASSLQNVILGKYNSSLKKTVKDCDLVVCRTPSFPAYKAADYAKKSNVPYLTESMGCAWDAYWNHGLSGKIIAPYMFLKMRSTVKNADYAIYVTSEFLQKKYPCKNRSIAASNVLINETEQMVLEGRLRKIREMDTKAITIVTTAAVNVRYKGQEYVIKAIPLLNKKGIKVSYIMIGEGDNSYLQAVANQLEVTDQVTFTGSIPLQNVLETIDSADIYIQPSLQEGLPRSVIEAMSRGCPCIGANTAGIPELLSQEYVVKRKSAKAIADCIFNFCNKPMQERCENAKRNFEEAEKYTKEVLNARRTDYFNLIKKEIVKS